MFCPICLSSKATLEGVTAIAKHCGRCLALAMHANRHAPDLQAILTLVLNVHYARAVRCVCVTQRLFEYVCVRVCCACAFELAHPQPICIHQKSLPLIICLNPFIFLVN